MSACSDAGYNDGPIDPTNGLAYYCLDSSGNPAYVSGNSGGLAPGATPAPIQAAGGDPNSILGDIGVLENDFLTAFRTVTSPPPPPPGTAGISIAGGSAGTQVAISPILILAIVAVVYLVAVKH